jgi:DNA mismatch repair protein MutS
MNRFGRAILRREAKEMSCPGLQTHDSRLTTDDSRFTIDDSLKAIAKLTLMQVDKTTLADLSIFHSEPEQSLFHHLDHTHTNGGRDELRVLLQNPHASLEAVLDAQQTIRCLLNVLDQWPPQITNGTVMMMEKFFDSQLDRFNPNPSRFDAFLFKLFSKHDFSLIRYSVQHAYDFHKGLQDMAALLEQQPLSRQLGIWVTRMKMLLDRPMIQELIAEDKKNISPVNLLRYCGFLRNQKTAAFELMDIYSKLDARLSLAIACRKHDYTFPTVTQAAQPFIKSIQLYHPLLTTPVAYDIDLSIEKNFLFLTGANMAGKSTFIKSVGAAAYLAHLGMGVPAKEMHLSFLDGLLSNIQVVDNIIKGESFFFNEVQRIKNTVEKISDGKNWLILIDELFKGTNQQDAVKCSVTVIEGLRKMKNALFVLSTHLYEIGEELKKHGNIQFYYFETAVQDDQLLFSYKLKEGISNDRLGYLILKKEGVVDLLEKL